MQRRDSTFSIFPERFSNRRIAILIAVLMILVCSVIKSITLRFIFIRIETLYFVFLGIAFYQYTKCAAMSVIPLVKNLAAKDIMRTAEFERPKFLNIGFNDIEIRANFWHFKHKNFAYCASQGFCKYMEDRMHYLHDPSMNLSIFAIFDGHGGQFVSDYLEANFAKCIRKRLQKFANKRKISMLTTEQKDPVEQAIITEVLKIDDSISNLDPQYTTMCGSTLISAIVEGNRYLTVVSVGDSRAVACTAAGKAWPLSKDHKPYDKEEKRRIEAAGGFVSTDQDDTERVQGILAVARSFGDTYLKELGVLTAHPSTIRIDLKEQKLNYIIVATDGFWDVFSNGEAVKQASHYLRGSRRGTWHQVAQRLVNDALRKGTQDNVSVLLLRFR